MRSIPLSRVFGVAGDAALTHSYVDRGGLDERLQYLLDADRHIAIHGDSKQGKSWLRSRALSDKKAIVVQCQPDSTTEWILENALGTLGTQVAVKRTKGSGREGAVELEASGEVGAGFLGKLGVKSRVSGKGSATSTTESTPLGEGVSGLAWVAKKIKDSGRRLIVEDFHYLSEVERQRFAYMLKALYDLRVFVILVGVWPQDHFISYYNGDLDGRVEDVHLQWSESELELVLTTGASALEIALSAPLRRQIVQDSYSNVGLLQRIAEHLCREEQILKSSVGQDRFLTISDSLETARRNVAAGMNHRYVNFSDNFVRGMRRLSEGLEVYKHLLQVLTESSDEQLVLGIDSSELLRRLNETGQNQLRQSDLTQALERIDRLQAKIGVQPPVLTYHRYNRRVYVVDRAFLFFRKYGAPTWPWEDERFSPTNDLAESQPLDLS